MTTELATLDHARIDLIKQTVAKGASDLELELFLHACKHTGLDPLMKQIYAIKRWSQADQREVLSFQTGIDGYRLIADRTGKYAGSSDAIFEEKDGKPLLAQVTVLKVIDGEKCAFTASARWEEYVQRNRQMEPTSMWKKMPFLMLAKCAEAQALRKAFPMELSGLYTNEEMAHLDSEWKQPLRTGAEMLAELENKPVDGAGVEQTIPSVPQQASDAPAHHDNPSEPWKAKLRTAHTSKEVNHLQNTLIPEELRQDTYGDYTAKLKELKGK
jgi:phage recombination protein Bet